MNYVWVALGGAFGSMLRYWTVHWIGKHYSPVFPWGTLAVNTLGCFLIAWIGALGSERLSLTAEMRLFLFTGILGGFTTFSAFGYETFYFLKSSQYAMAIVNVLANVGLGMVAIILGYWLGR